MVELVAMVAPKALVAMSAPKALEAMMAPLALVAPKALVPMVAPKALEAMAAPLALVEHAEMMLEALTAPLALLLSGVTASVDEWVKHHLITQKEATRAVARQSSDQCHVDLALRTISRQL